MKKTKILIAFFALTLVSAGVTTLKKVAKNPEPVVASTNSQHPGSSTESNSAAWE
jgi:hypothetical protein